MKINFVLLGVICATAPIRGYEVQIANMTGQPIILNGAVNQKVTLDASIIKGASVPLQPSGPWVPGDLLNTKQVLPPAVFNLAAGEVLVLRLPDTKVTQELPFGTVSYDFSDVTFVVATSYQTGEATITSSYSGLPLPIQNGTAEPQPSKVYTNALGALAVTASPACVFYTIGLSADGTVVTNKTSVACLATKALRYGAFDITSDPGLVKQSIEQLIKDIVIEKRAADAAAKSASQVNAAA